MKKLSTLIVLSFALTYIKAQSTIPTTTINGSLRVTDSLQVTNDIRSTGDISTSGNMNAAAVVASGEVTATDTMRAKKDVLVDGNAIIGGDLRVGGLSTLNNLSVTDKLILGNNMALKATVNSATGATDFNLGSVSSQTDPGTNPDISPCYDMPNISSLNYQNGKMSFWGATSNGTKALNIGHDGVQSFIDAAGGSGTMSNRLLINYYCGKDIYMCTGTGVGLGGSANGLAGGVVSMGPNVEVGSPIRDKQIAFNMVAKSTMTDVINIKSKFNTTDLDIFSIGAKGGAKITTTDASSNFAGFITPYALSVFNRNKNREVLKVANLGTIYINTDNTTPDGAVVVNNVDLNKTIFKIFSNGKTQIGSGTPKVGGQATNALLSVDGLVLAKEVKIAIATTHWADYVFNRDYKLMPLNDLEKFINTNKHLPEIPSTKEVETNGIDVVEMQAGLLKKIEELTLYLLEQNKRIENLEKENKELKNK